MIRGVWPRHTITEVLCNPAWQMQDKYATMHRLVANSLIHVEIRVEVAERENRNV